MYDAALAAKFGDAILRVYRRADQLVGEVLERVEPGTTVLDRVGPRLPLVAEGGQSQYLAGAAGIHGACRRQAPGEKKLDDLFGGGEFWENVDWSRTRAYAMGLGQIYFNLRGREARGIVSPGAEAKQLADELCARLLTMTDPEDGARIVRAVYKRDDVYAGEFLHNASELQVGMEDGYRVSWQTTLGGSPQGIVYPNMKKWSGDHGGYDFATTAGVLDLEQAGRVGDAVHHGHRADGPEVFRRADSRRHRWQTASSVRTASRTRGFGGSRLEAPLHAKRFGGPVVASREARAVRSVSPGVLASAFPDRSRPRAVRKRRPNVPASASARCSARPKRSSRRRASCSSSCGSSSSNARSRSRSCRRSTSSSRRRRGS